MITKEDFKYIVKSELIPLKLNLITNKKTLENYLVSNFTNDYQLESYYDNLFLNIINIFFKLNAVLINIKHNIISQKTNMSLKSKVNQTFGPQNGNNIYDLFCFVEEETNIKFSPMFIYYCVIIETLVRHQYSHGFGKTLLYLMDNQKSVTLFHDYDRWNKYKEIEGNENAFYSINLYHMNDHDFYHSTYIKGNFTCLFNTRSFRTIIQYLLANSKKGKSLPLDYFISKNKQNPLLDKQISIHKYKENWEKVHYSANKNEYIMFPNFKCDHINNKDCFLCKINKELSTAKTLPTLKKQEIIQDRISKHNLKRCENIFYDTIINKLSNQKLKKLDYIQFNEYFKNVFNDIWGKSIKYNYYLAFNECNDKKTIISNINNMFNLLIESDKLIQFICYKFYSKNFQPILKKEFTCMFNLSGTQFSINTTDDLLINYNSFLKMIKLNFLEFYRKL